MPYIKGKIMENQKAPKERHPVLNTLKIDRKKTMQKLAE